LKSNITPKKPKLCIGGMSHRIKIQKRTQRFQSGGQVVVFETVWTVWSAIETRSGMVEFNDINIESVVTHIFKIRRLNDVTTEYWVNYKSNNYKILAVEHNNDADHTLLHCRLTGLDTKGGSKS